MEETSQENKAIFSVDMDSEELQEILDRLDEHLAFRQVLQRDENHVGDEALGAEQSLAIPDLPSLDRLIALSDWLKMSSAPLRPSMGVGGLRGLVLRLLNLPVRFFGSSEIEFNRRQRDFIGELIPILNAVQSQNAALKSAVLSLGSSLETVITVDRKDRVVESESVSSQERISALIAQVDALKLEVDQISTRFAVDEETKTA